ncbi:MAG: 2Fe-2S iron-sulfur cluster binding domain-containing protein, partial [Planctomycetes bacterium]|nr:2Fe-2S iron-sulfur cluster binding domain-containing protein [Planctomycetota bacterium]
MPHVEIRPSGKSITVPAGTNLLEACHRAGVGISASCGGKGLCGKCRVRIIEGSVPEHAGYEHPLSRAEIEAGWRLACLVKVGCDLVIDTNGSEPVRNIIITDFHGVEATADGAVKAVPLELPHPDLEDQTCDMGRIMNGLGMDEYPRASLPLMQILPSLIRDNDYRITAVMYGDEILGIEPYRENPRVLGMAYDIGTTTIAGALFDLSSGELLAVASRTNPQALHGDDVVSRIDHAGKGKAEREEMQALVVGALDEILSEACVAVGAAAGEVYYFTAGGNTTMHHMLLGLDPTNIARTPFIPAVRRGLLVRATHVGLGAGHGARLYALPNISAYVGGDIV